MQKHPSKKLAIWTTRHPPTQGQRQALERAGYQLILMPMRQFRRAEAILETIRVRIQQEPDLIIAAMPKSVMHWLAQTAPCPVLLAVMDYRTGQDNPRWTGRWQRVIRTKLETEPYNL